jgi:hypothetical protein
VEPPLAPWIDQAIGHQRLEDLESQGAFPRGRQPGRPERVQLQPRPQLHRQPAGTPLARPLQHQLGQVHLYRRDIWRRRAVVREERQLHRLPLVNRRDGPAPPRLLRVIEFAQIQERLLDGPPAPDTSVLDNTPVSVLFAILLSSGRPQKHTAHSRWTQAARQEGRSSPQRGVTLAPTNMTQVWRMWQHKKSVYRPSCEDGIVTSTRYEVLALAQLYRDRADAENNFDELKNQWGWGGFTTQDLARCRSWRGWWH